MIQIRLVQSSSLHYLEVWENLIHLSVNRCPAAALLFVVNLLLKRVLLLSSRGCRERIALFRLFDFAQDRAVVRLIDRMRLCPSLASRMSQRKVEILTSHQEISNNGTILSYLE